MPPFDHQPSSEPDSTQKKSMLRGAIPPDLLRRPARLLFLAHCSLQSAVDLLAPRYVLLFVDGARAIFAEQSVAGAPGKGHGDPAGGGAKGKGWAGWLAVAVRECCGPLEKSSTFGLKSILLHLLEPSGADAEPRPKLVCTNTPTNIRRWIWGRLDLFTVSLSNECHMF